MSFFQIVEITLECVFQIVAYGLLGIFLHLRVDGGVNLQTVFIDIIRSAVGFQIAVAPAAQRVCGPLNRVFDVLCLRRVAAAVGFCGVHLNTQELAEIGSRTLLVVNTVEVEAQGELL